MEDRRAEEGMKQQQENQDRRSKSENPLHQQQPPQKCPRCDSLNTKFCYYNNYSLSQPRYFCKTCRRYWTQGGTLRNIPVGGGCRKGKGKHSKASSSSGSDNSISKSPSSLPTPLQPSLQLQHQQLQVHVPQNLAAFPANSNLQKTSSFLHNMSSYYSDGGFLSSLDAVQSLSQPQSFNNQAVNAGDRQYGGGGGLLHGLNIQNLGSQQDQPHHHHNQLHQIGSRDKNPEQIYLLYQNTVQPSRTVGSWTHSFINSQANRTPPNFSFRGSSSTSNDTNSSTAAGNSLEPNQWPNIPDYGPLHP